MQLFNLIQTFLDFLFIYKVPYRIALLFLLLLMLHQQFRFHNSSISLLSTRRGLSHHATLSSEDLRKAKQLGLSGRCRAASSFGERHKLDHSTRMCIWNILFMAPRIK